MPDSDILYKSITEIQKNLVNKKISSVELTKLALKRIDETNNKTNAFLHVAHDFAINEAKKGIKANIKRVTAAVVLLIE